MKSTISLLLGAFIMLVGIESLYANNDSHVATLTRKFGKVRILSNPQKKVQGPPPHALYNGKYYSERKSKRGDTLNNGEVIMVGKGSRARLIFDNGDQITVSPDTAYKIDWDPNNPKSKPEVSLLMGKIRSSVENGGPRAGLKIRTRSMVMGVRGTDFYVSARGKTGDSEVSVIRGKVEVKPANVKKAKPIEVPAGFSVNVGLVKPPAPKKPTAAGKPAPAPAPKQIKISLKKTTKTQLETIYNETKISKPVPIMVASNASAEEKEKINTMNAKVAKLEKQAVVTTVADIKKSDPELYEKIKDRADKIDDVDLVKKEVHAKSKEAAPEKINVKKKKPNLDSEDGDVYEEFYKLDWQN